MTFERTLPEAWEFESIDIATVPITGGEAVRLGDSERQYRGVEHRGMAWSEDGSGLYVTLVAYADLEASVLDPDSGIWVFGADGEHARQLLSVAGSDDWPPRIMAVSPRGEHVLVRLPGTYRGLVDCCAIVDGVSGAIEPIEPLGPEAPQSMAIIGAQLSPDGSLLLTVSASEDRERQVAVRDVAGRHETILLTERPGDAPSDLTGRVSTWAQNDTVLILGDELDRGTLLVLDRGSDDDAGSLLTCHAIAVTRPLGRDGAPAIHRSSQGVDCRALGDPSHEKGQLAGIQPRATVGPSGPATIREVLHV